MKAMFAFAGSGIEIEQIGHAVYMAFAMFCEILWASDPCFFLYAVVQAVVSKREVVKVQA